MRVLVVDDNPDDRLLAARAAALACPGCDVAEAGSPEGFAAALAEAVPDVAVLDYALGWTDGLALMARVRAADPDCAVVLHTGSLGEEGAVAAMRAGADDYVVKGPGGGAKLRAALVGAAARRAERRARREAEGRYRDLWARVGVGVFAVAGGRVVDANPALRRMLGLSGPAGWEASALLPEREDLSALLDPPVGGTQARPVCLRWAGGEAHALMDAHRSAGGGVEALLTDVTALRRALEERSVLLREVAHRVYNNLQLALTLVDVEAARAGEGAAGDGYRRLAGRLGTVARVQRRLMSAADLADMPLHELVREVADGVLALAPPGRVRLELELEPLSVPVGVATPVAMAVNELATNAVKHAFPGDREGTLRITLRRVGGMAELVVADDGAGLPPDACQGGMAILQALAAQAGGTLCFADAGPGTVATLRFPCRDGTSGG